MESCRFDQLVKSFGIPSSRRSVLGILAAFGLVGAAAIAEDASLPPVGALGVWLGDGDARAKKKRHNKRKSRKKKECGKVGRKPVKGKCCKGSRPVDGTCSRPPCDVCASGCPHTTVQAAVDAAKNGDTLTVCAGTYLGNIVIAKDLTISGAGDGADPTTNTVLDGAGAGTVVTIAAGAGVSLKTLRVTGGNGELGGGINAEHSTLDLAGCTVSGNTANDGGGGIYHFAGTLTLSDSTVSDNTANNKGGGIDHADGTLHLADSIVSGNAAGGGGGLFIDGFTTVTLSDCTVRDNMSNTEGGGIQVDDDVVTLTLTNCTVQGNTAGTTGGGMFAAGMVTLSNSIVRDNRANDPGGSIAGDGGGILNGLNGVLTLEASAVRDNHATFDGGGIANYATVSCSADSSVSGNTAGTAGTENCFDVNTGTGCATCPA